MQGIRQIQVGVDVVQDRLVLRIATVANEEVRIFLTRRFLREIWPALMQMRQRLHRPALARETASPAGSAGLGKFEEPFRVDNPCYPLGSAPLLASEMTLEEDETGAYRIILREARERSFAFPLGEELAEALCAMLRAGAEKADWNLKLDYDIIATVSATATTPTLH